MAALSFLKLADQPDPQIPGRSCQLAAILELLLEPEHMDNTCTFGQSQQVGVGIAVVTDPPGVDCALDDIAEGSPVIAGNGIAEDIDLPGSSSGPGKQIDVVCIVFVCDENIHEVSAVLAVIRKSLPGVGADLVAAKAGIGSGAAVLGHIDIIPDQADAVIRGHRVR